MQLDKDGITDCVQDVRVGVECKFQTWCEKLFLGGNVYKMWYIN